MKKKTENKLTREKMLAILFLAVIGIFSVLSFKNIAAFYLFDKVSYNEWTAEAGTAFETDYIANFPGKMQFVNFNGAMRNFLGQAEMNRVIKMENGYLTTPVAEVSEEMLAANANKTAQLYEQLAKKGIPVLYVMTPYSVAKYDSCLPVGVEDFGNQNMDIFVEHLALQGVPYVDIREEMQKDGINPYDMWYRTDHHWNTRGGFYAHTKVLDALQELGVAVDMRFTDIEDYTIQNYEEWHLGSNGQRTGVYYAGIDDFELIVPNFGTSIQNAAGETGTFEQMLIDYGPLAEKNYESRYTYDTVLKFSHYGEWYRNLQADNDTRIIVVCDSMARAVNPYLLLAVDSVYTMDAYSPQQLTKEFVEEYKPDAVIVMHYVDKVGNEAVFRFGEIN